MCECNSTHQNGVQGNVMPSRFEVLRTWKREYSMEKILMELRREMANASNRKLSQPQEGTLY